MRSHSLIAPRRPRRMMARAIVVLALVLLAVPAGHGAARLRRPAFLNARGPAEVFQQPHQQQLERGAAGTPRAVSAARLPTPSWLDDSDWTAGIEVKGQKCIYAEDGERT
jgi:hypothetical protein